MATFVKTAGVRGVRHKAIVRIKGYPSATKTFATRKSAQEWARNTERDIESGKANPDAAGRSKTFSPLVELQAALAPGHRKRPEQSHPPCVVGQRKMQRIRIQHHTVA
jgi:hypothetical protein